MSKRYANIISYCEAPDKIDGMLYNLWKKVWMKKRRPLRIQLNENRELTIIMYKDHWLVVDSKHDVLPLLGWEKFEVKSKKNSPVSCKLNYYHYMAHSWGQNLRGIVLQKLRHELLSGS